MRRSLSLVLLAVFGVACENISDGATDLPLELGDVMVSAAAGAIGAALDHVAELPESRDPVRFGSRTFEVSGKVLVKVDADVVDVESLIQRRGWTLVVQSPRTCGETWDLADSGGYPYCWLQGDPDALYLRVSSARSLGAGGYEVVVHPYRKAGLPDNHDLESGLIPEFRSPTGRWEDHDFDGHKAEYVRLLSGTSDHPGILNDGGEFRVQVRPDGTVRHEGEFSGWYYSSPDGSRASFSGGARGTPRVGHIGPVNPEKTDAEKRYDAMLRSCRVFEWDSKEHRKCRREAYEFRSEEIYQKGKERLRAVVEAVRAIVRDGEMRK